VVSLEGQTLPDAIEQTADPLLRAHGLILVDLEVARGGRRSLVRFFVDKAGGVTIDDCRRFSEEIGDLLDVESVMPGSYDLEVSSPGLDRELRKDRELRWAVDRQVRVFTREPVEGLREHAGLLVEVGPEILTLVVADASRRIPRTLVTKARLELPVSGSPGDRRRS
jgi:ribosome maturation factor RimP